MSSRYRSSFAESAAMLVLGVTGGPEDEWVRLRRVYRTIGFSSRVVFFAAALATPVLIQEMLRRWANGAMARR